MDRTVIKTVACANCGETIPCITAFTAYNHTICSLDCLDDLVEDIYAPNYVNVS